METRSGFSDVWTVAVTVDHCEPESGVLPDTIPVWFGVPDVILCRMYPLSNQEAYGFGGNWGEEKPSDGESVLQRKDTA